MRRAPSGSSATASPASTAAASRSSSKCPRSSSSGGVGQRAEQLRVRAPLSVLPPSKPKVVLAKSKLALGTPLGAEQPALRVAPLFALVAVLAGEGQFDPGQVAPGAQALGQRGLQRGAVGPLLLLDREDDHERGGEGLGRVDLPVEDRLAVLYAVEGQQLAFGLVGILAGEGDFGVEGALADERRVAGAARPRGRGGLDQVVLADRQAGEVEVTVAVELDLDRPQFRRGASILGRDFAADVDRDRRLAIARQGLRGEASRSASAADCPSGRSLLRRRRRTPPRRREQRRLQA